MHTECRHIVFSQGHPASCVYSQMCVRVSRLLMSVSGRQRPALCAMGLQYRRRSGTWSCAFPSTCGDQTHCPRLRCGSCRNEHQGASVSTDSRSVSTDAHALGLTPVHDGLAFVSRKLATARVPIRTVPLRQPRHARCNRLITADRLQTRAHVLHHLSGASAHPYGCSGTPRMREVSGYF